MHKLILVLQHGQNNNILVTCAEAQIHNTKIELFRIGQKPLVSDNIKPEQFPRISTTQSDGPADR